MLIMTMKKGLVGVKTEDSAHAAALLHQVPSELTLAPPERKRSVSTGRLMAWGIEHLPKGCNVDDAFKLVAAPTYLQMIGHHKSPFSIPDKEDLLAMQAIFNYVYQAHQEYRIKAGSLCPVFGVVCFFYLHRESHLH